MICTHQWSSLRLVSRTRYSFCSHCYAVLLHIQISFRWFCIWKWCMCLVEGTTLIALSYAMYITAYVQYIVSIRAWCSHLTDLAGLLMYLWYIRFIKSFRSQVCYFGAPNWCNFLHLATSKKGVSLSQEVELTLQSCQSSCSVKKQLTSLAKALGSKKQSLWKEQVCVHCLLFLYKTIISPRANIPCIVALLFLTTQKDGTAVRMYISKGIKNIE